MALRFCRCRVTWMGLVLGAVALKLALNRRRTVWYTAHYDEPECRVAGVYTFEAEDRDVSPVYTGHLVVLS